METPAPDAGAGFHAARGVDARSAHAGGDRRDGRQAQGRQQRARRSARGDAADDARDRRPHDVLVRDGSARRRVARFRDGVWRAAGAAAFSRSGAAAGLADPAGFCPRPFPQALDRVRRHADGRTPRRRQERGRAGARPVRPDGRRARSGNRRGLYRRAARRSDRDHDSGRPRDHGDGAVLGALFAGARSCDPGSKWRRRCRAQPSTARSISSG